MTTKWYVIMIINYVHCMAKTGGQNTRNIIGKQGSGIVSSQLNLDQSLTLEKLKRLGDVQ